MHAVRRLLGITGLAALLTLGPAAAWAADPTPSADPSATASASPTAAPSAAPTPSDSAKPSAAPTAGGCDQDPVICESTGGPVGEPGTTTDCDPFAASPPPSGVVCIAGGVRPVLDTGAGSGTGGAAPGRLPRTGPAPLLPTMAIGSWLVLLGVLAAVAGRRRTARI